MGWVRQKEKQRVAKQEISYDYAQKEFKQNDGVGIS
jgi:cytochrome c oxidase assembly factor CtaG